MHSPAQIVQSVLLVLEGAMGEVEPGNVHARPQQLLQDGDLARLGPQSADDLGLGDLGASIVGCVTQDGGNFDLGGHGLLPWKLN